MPIHAQSQTTNEKRERNIYITYSHLEKKRNIYTWRHTNKIKNSLVHHMT